MIVDEDIVAKYNNDPEGLAGYFIDSFFKYQDISFPINPFGTLEKLGVSFVLRNLENLEGVLIADGKTPDSVLIAINAKRNIQRQRYTCAHEICHLLKDVGRYDPWSCFADSKKEIERYAENFAACFLMPRKAVVAQVNKIITSKYLSGDDILKISHFFGTSFQACLYRISSCVPRALPPNYAEKYKDYKPVKQRQKLGLADSLLYSQFINSCAQLWPFPANQYASNAFKNKFVFNDARLEGIDVSLEAAAEIVTDIRVNNSQICRGYTPFSEIAGHSALYDTVFEEARNNSQMDIYKILTFNRILFSYALHPEFGGRTRRQNTIVLGGGFETVDYHEISSRLIDLDKKVRDLDLNRNSLSRTDVLYQILEIHHELTVIHPFCDGNGRTARAFMNFQLIRYGFPPVYIDLDDKAEYLNALADADSAGNVDKLFGIISRMVIKSHADFYSIND